MDISDVDTVWTWGEQTSPLPKCINFSESFSSSLLKLPNNNHKDFKSVERPLELEKFKLHRKIFSGWKGNKELVRGIRTHDLTRLTLKSYSQDVVLVNAWSICNFIIKK